MARYAVRGSVCAGYSGVTRSVRAATTRSRNLAARMDRRTLLALLLTAIVIVATPIIFPSSRQQRPPIGDTLAIAPNDTARTVTSIDPAAPPTARAPTVSAPTVSAPTRTSAPQHAAPTRPETTIVQTKLARYAIVSYGGTPGGITLPAYRSLRPGISRETPVSLLEPGARLFHLLLAGDADTIALDTVRFRAAPQRLEGNTIVQALTSVTAAPAITLTYRFPADSFAVRVEGSVSGPSVPRRLLVTLPTRIRSEEADVLDDTRHLALSYRMGAEIEKVS